MLTNLSPMRAQTAETAFDSDRFLFEPQWQGKRSFVYVDRHHTVHLAVGMHRPDIQLFPELAILQQLPAGTLLDGHLMDANEPGNPGFEVRRRLAATHAPLAPPPAPLTYQAFDLLHYKNHDVRHEPLINRRVLLDELLAPFDATAVTACRYRLTHGKSFLHTLVKHGFQGMVAKDLISVYLQGLCSPNWLTITHMAGQQAEHDEPAPLSMLIG